MSGSQGRPLTVIAPNDTALVIITVVSLVEIRYSRGVRKREIHSCQDAQITRNLHFCKGKLEDMPHMTCGEISISSPHSDNTPASMSTTV